MSGGLWSADQLLRPEADLPAITCADAQPAGDQSASDQPASAQPATGEPAGDQRLIPAKSSWARAFPGVPRQVSAARRFVSSLLDGSPLRDDAVIVISELFTNALQHTDSGRPGGLIVVQVSRWRQAVRIAVTDQGSARCPVIRGRRGDHDNVAGISAHRAVTDGTLADPVLADPVLVGPALSDRVLTDSMLAGGIFADDILADSADTLPGDCGRGLYMVSCLAERLDWHDDAGGRTVHAVLGRLPAGSPRRVDELD